MPRRAPAADTGRFLFLIELFMNRQRFLCLGLLLGLLSLTACRAALAQPAVAPPPAVVSSAATAAAPTLPTVAPAMRERFETRPEWQRRFAELGTAGTLVVLDTRTQRWSASDPARAFQGFLPASTFKIPMSLIALETGTAKDAAQPFAWDGVKRSLPDWNRDQTLASAYRVSAVWVFRQLAREIGQPTVQQFLRDFRYGNAVAGPQGDSFWLDGDLRISAVGQIDFLRRLHDRALPLSDRTYGVAREVMLRDRGPGWSLYAKTGWAGDIRPGLGWFVGWAERDADPRPVYFALNMDMLKDELGPRRVEIVLATLREIGAID